MTSWGRGSCTTPAADGCAHGDREKYRRHPTASPNPHPTGRGLVRARSAWAARLGSVVHGYAYDLSGGSGGRGEGAYVQRTVGALGDTARQVDLAAAEPVQVVRVPERDAGDVPQ